MIPPVSNALTRFAVETTFKARLQYITHGRISFILNSAPTQSLPSLRMSYTNPLHYSGAPSTSFSSLSSAFHGAQQNSSFISPRRRRLPQAVYTPGGKWNNATGRVTAVHHPITFDYIGYHKQGVPMRELSARSSHALAQMIQGSNDLVFAHTGIQKITFHILWPGYPHVEWSRSIEVNTSMGPITRGQLGTLVASMFARFIEKTQYEATTTPEWRVGPHSIRFENLILLSVWNVLENSWQADVAVDL